MPKTSKSWEISRSRKTAENLMSDQIFDVQKNFRSADAANHVNRDPKGLLTWCEALSDDKNALVHLRWENRGFTTFPLKITASSKFQPSWLQFIVFQVSFRARQLLKKSPRDALQSVIKQSSRFERLKVVQKTNLPLEVDEKWWKFDFFVFDLRV